jgi:hypothetical protein
MYFFCRGLKFFLYSYLIIFLSSAVDGLKVGVQGGGQFRQQLIGEDFSVTIVYPEMKEKFAKLFGDLHRACESTPVDGNYK